MSNIQNEQAAIVEFLRLHSNASAAIWCSILAVYAHVYLVVLDREKALRGCICLIKVSVMFWSVRKASDKSMAGSMIETPHFAQF